MAELRRVRARDLAGLVRCPWGCETVVRRTVNPRGFAVHIDLEPDARGNIAAYDAGGTWRSRHLKKGEGLAPHERRYVIHQATCRRYAAQNGRPFRPPRPAPVPPPPGPPRADLITALRADLQTRAGMARAARQAEDHRDDS